IAYAFSGYLVAITNNLLYLMAAATFPCALWAVDRLFSAPSVLRLTGAAALLSLVLYAGDSQSFCIACAFALLFVLIRHQKGRARSELAWAAGLLGLTAAISGAQLFTAWDTLKVSKAGDQPMDVSLIWSMHPLRLLEMFVGPFFAA